MSSAAFYDDFLSSQIKSGINDRIYKLYKKVLKNGLHAEDNILEVGCGIGAFTFLLSRKVKRGVVEAIDLSQKSIEFAKHKVVQNNISFFAADIVRYQPQMRGLFDKILLFDVLEHIPKKEHRFVFNKLESLLKQGGLLLINLPNPQYIVYDSLHQPEVLQELDQPVYLHELVEHFKEANLELFCFEIHSVWVKDDYQFLIVRKQQAFSEEFLQAKRNYLQKAVLRLQRIFRRLQYRF